MSIYQKLIKIGSRYFGLATLFKVGFNLAPMYRRSTARVSYVSDDLKLVKIKLPINYKNRNYMNTIFGGSMFAAVDPIPMLQLVNLLGEDYMVWDKSAEIYFRRPAHVDLYAEFRFSEEELVSIKNRLTLENEIDIVKHTQLCHDDVVYCEIYKTLYVSTKAFYQQKRKNKTTAAT